jgi:hypothetical protein
MLSTSTPTPSDVSTAPAQLAEHKSCSPTDDSAGVLCCESKEAPDCARAVSGVMVWCVIACERVRVQPAATPGRLLATSLPPSLPPSNNTLTPPVSASTASSTSNSSIARGVSTAAAAATQAALPRASRWSNYEGVCVRTMYQVGMCTQSVRACVCHVLCYQIVSNELVVRRLRLRRLRHASDMPSDTNATSRFMFRDVYQYQYVAWPDHGLPVNTRSVRVRCAVWCV